MAPTDFHFLYDLVDRQREPADVAWVVIDIAVLDFDVPQRTVKAEMTIGYTTSSGGLEFAEVSYEKVYSREEFAQGFVLDLLTPGIDWPPLVGWSGTFD